MFNWFKKAKPIVVPNIIYIEEKCPYCLCPLTKEVKRNQKCKSCGEEIVVKKDYLTGDKLLLTIDEAHLYEIKEGKCFNDSSKSYFSSELRKYKKEAGLLRGVVVLSTTNSCSACKALSGKVYTIDEAIKERFLPCKQCTYQDKKGSAIGVCRCCYAPAV